MTTIAAPSFSWRARLGDYWRLTRMHRPIGILLLLWPTLWALWIAAGGIPPLWILAIFVAGTVLMRAAGCAINDYADRDFDAHVERTRDRPLAAGRIRPGEAVAVAVVLALAALAVAWPLPVLALWLAVPGAFIAAIYPFMKRYTHWPQAYLGVAFSWGIPMAFAALRPDVPWGLVLALMGVNFCWIIAYDTLYAMADRPDDLKIGVKSTAILFGRYDRLCIGLFQLAALGGLAAIGVWQGFGPWFYLGVGAATLCAVIYQWMARERERVACFRAFVANNWFGAAVFVGLVLDFAVQLRST
ncbi:MAG TPA: 4-hydroxybenzoate octaprenyltransferase [Nevskiaceae bacterium]|nr:4-hydroxybenzoate octaprenyltransferase [Nevskiaceae bacterium]